MKQLLLLISFGLFTSIAFGAINFTYVGDTADYTKPTADFVGLSDVVQLDITGDGTGYSIQSSAESTQFNWPIRAKISTLSNGAFESWNYLDDNGYLLQFNFGVNISYNGAFAGSSPGSGDIVGDGLTTGFSANTSYYIPIVLKDGNDEYFGWIKIKTLDNDYAVVVESYAWNDQANGAIFAGQGEQSSSVIETESIENTVLIENPFEQVLSIHNSGDQAVSMKIYDAFGKLVKQSILASGNNKIEVNLPVGVYFAVIENRYTIRLLKK